MRSPNFGEPYESLQRDLERWLAEKWPGVDPGNSTTEGRIPDSISESHEVGLVSPLQRVESDFVIR